MHKTATKSIQTALNHYSDGVTRYASLGPSNHSIPLMTAFRSDPHEHYYYVKRGINEEATRQAAIEIRQKLLDELHTPEQTLVFSGEEMVQIRREDIAKMKRFFEQYSRQIRVLAYIREPVGLASSLFQQLIRHRRITELDVIEAYYKRRFAKFIKLFGLQRMEFVPFDKQQLFRGCIISDFCQRIGVDASQMHISYKNQSLSAEAVALLLQWNRHGIQSTGSDTDVKATSKLISLLRQEYPGKFTFNRDLVMSRIDHADREWMEKQAGFSLTCDLANDNRTSSDTGIKSGAELDELADAAVPQLHQILQANGLTSNANTPASLLDVLFLNFRDSI